MSNWLHYSFYSSLEQIKDLEQLATRLMQGKKSNFMKSTSSLFTVYIECLITSIKYNQVEY